MSTALLKIFGLTDGAILFFSRVLEILKCRFSPYAGDNVVIVLIPASSLDSLARKSERKMRIMLIWPFTTTGEYRAVMISGPSSTQALHRGIFQRRQTKNAVVSFCHCRSKLRETRSNLSSEQLLLVELRVWCLNGFPFWVKLFL